MTSLSERLLYSFYPLIAETILFGILSCLISLSTYLLLWRPRTPGTVLMLVVTVSMYIAAIMHWSAYLSVTIYYFTDPLHASFAQENTNNPRQTLVSLGVAANVVFSDVIVIWRAWILCDKETWVLLTSITLLLATTIGAALNLLYGHVLAASYATTVAWPVVTAVITLVTNIWATALVARKTWLHRRFIRENMREGTRRTRVELSLTIIVESGAIYCVYLVFVLLCSHGLLGRTSAALAATVPQVAAIYPTTLVVLLCLRQDDSKPVFSLQRQTEFQLEVYLPSTGTQIVERHTVEATQLATSRDVLIALGQ
ncbi:hypothetical protein BV25DRAFT_1420265 [Artomyces pyxidatus]|uniref:Uncharacterized protein n=1 Tax=Artomyces pyxidatus TaxID=48021 RepID=A0ACB8TE63_9AGAM|nr:hypothetical protein BV25DRAFT_1420265 [Artomyces pyxidatus]